MTFSQFFIAILGIFIIVAVGFLVLAEAKERVTFCDNKTGMQDTCDYIDYKWYQPHNCFVFNCSEDGATDIDMIM